MLFANLKEKKLESTLIAGELDKNLMQLSGKVQNMHLGNCGKMDEETAKQKARAIESRGPGYQDLKIARIAR